MSLSETAPEKAQESDYQTVGSRVNPACALSMESPFKAFSSVFFLLFFSFVVCVDVFLNPLDLVRMPTESEKINSSEFPHWNNENSNHSKVSPH